jgi:hypothetical protein
MKVREYGENAAVIVGRADDVQLSQDVSDVLLHGVVTHDEDGGDAVVGASLGHQRQDFGVVAPDAAAKNPSRDTTKLAIAAIPAIRVARLSS